jgi:poly-gamma-glutamate synthesis protein (capsule biosynthesis protein)
MRSLAPIVGALLLAATATVNAASPAPLPSPGAPETSPAPAGQLVVPVQRFWSPLRDLSLDELRDAVAGRSDLVGRVLVAADDAPALWRSLDVTPGPSTTSASVDEVVTAVARSGRVLGLVPLEAVRPELRALRVDGQSLFGGDRVDPERWPLRTVPAAPPGSPQPHVLPGVAAPVDAAWSLAAAGDVMLDREVYRQAVIVGKGPHHPWDGGLAEIISRRCCTVDGGNAIETRRAGRPGAVRALLSGADVALVNHEGPAPDDASYHPSGLVFTFDPALLEGVSGAGIDVVSLANNHIRNAGSRGVLQTMRNVRRAGLRAVGAGRDAQHARRPTCLDPEGVRLCFLAYDAINTLAHAATVSRPGAAELRIPDVRSDIRALRRDGADVIVVLPHWGTEYTSRVTAQQRRWARAMVRAGADAVLGAHSHVVGPLEFIDGVPVLYSMGDFLFDLPRFEETEEGVVAELSFLGDRLAQLELHPTVIRDRSQVALLDPAGDGAVVLERMRAASKRLD